MTNKYIVIFLTFCALGFLKICISTFPCLEYVNCNPNEGCSCGVENKDIRNNATETQSRIINGETSLEHRYPWMARIQRTTLLKVIGPTNPGNTRVIYGGGAIITKRVIITAGHIICVPPGNEDGGGGNIFHISCPERGSLSQQEWDKVRTKNLNQQTFNEITFKVGTNSLYPYPMEPLYNKDVQAYLYNYNPNVHLFSSTGDVAIVVTKLDIGFDGKLVHLICPPNKNNIGNRQNVKTAGWGRQYMYYRSPVSPFSVLRASCHTNQGRASSNIHDAEVFNQRYRFLDCTATNDGKTCHDWMIKKDIETLSAKTDLARIQTSKTSIDEKYLEIKNLVEQKECEKYFRNAKAAWRNQGKAMDDFYQIIDRILILKYGERTWTICYNIRKVASYGFCLTNEPFPRNWGFCSRSCEYASVGDDFSSIVGKPYEVATFDYFENNPNNQMTMQQLYPFWMGDEIQRAFKCISPVLPKAKNAVFREKNVNGFLEYLHDIYDAARPDSESGHIRTARGDSGSPLWTTKTDKGKEVSATATQ